MRNLLFVCGTARSGTTALTYLLNTHPRVVVGVERYRRLLTRFGKGDPDEIGEPIRRLFDRERLLFDHRPEDTRPFPPTEVTAAAAKYDQCLYVGDKVPALFRCLDVLGTACPEARFIYIVRDPVPVAASWQRRADNDADNWPSTRGYRDAVAMWNESVRCALAAIDTLGEDRVACVRYETLFSRGQARGLWYGLMDWLRLPAGGPLYGYTRLMLNDSIRRANSDRGIPECIERHVRASADSDLFERLCQRALRPAVAPAEGT